MNFLLHNRIEIKTGNKTYYFYNKMLNSVYSNLSELKSYNDFIALGTGNNKEESENIFKLDEFYKSYPLELEYLQDDIDDNTLYIKKTAVIDDSSLDEKLITEAGITDNNGLNPIIFNYFQFISNDTSGIIKSKGEPLVISIYIYLEISKRDNSVGLFTSGSNKFIDFLLGNGITNQVYACRGNILADNSKSIKREKPDFYNLVPCEVNIQNNQDGFEISFSANLGSGEAFEVLMLIGDEPFARISTIDENNVFIESKTSDASPQGTIEIGDNILSISEIKNLETQNIETGFFVSKFANYFGDKLYLPFNNLFDNSNSRFLSKDGKMIFFVIDNRIYGYKNDKYSIVEIDTSIVNISNIMNVISFENYAFVISKASPYINAFIIVDDKLESCEIEFTGFDNIELFSKILKCDMTLAHSGDIILGIIEEKNNYAHTLYFNFDISNKKFTFDSYTNSEFSFNYILAMYKNNYQDAMMIFLKGDKEAHKCKIVYFYSDRTTKDLYTTLSWYLTCDTKEIYTRGRAIIVEQLSTPKILIYLFPEISRISLEISEFDKDYIVSTNLKYLIQKQENNEFKFYNLSSIDTLTEFSSSLPANIDKSKIIDFEFLDDDLLIFLDDENTKIVAISLFENKTYIENVSSNENNYEITYSKYHIVGEDGNNVYAEFKVGINI